MPSKLSIVERHAGEAVILTLSGEMLLDDGDVAFGRYVSDLIGRGVVRIVVDLASDEAAAIRSFTFVP